MSATLAVLLLMSDVWPVARGIERPAQGRASRPDASLHGGASCSAPPTSGCSRIALLPRDPCRDRLSPVERLPADRDARRPDPHRVPAVNRSLTDAELVRELGWVDVIAENGWRRD